MPGDQLSNTARTHVWQLSLPRQYDLGEVAFWAVQFFSKTRGYPGRLDASANSESSAFKSTDRCGLGVWVKKSGLED